MVLNLIARLHGSGNQEVEVEVTLLTIQSNNQLAQFCFASWATLSSADLVLSPKRRENSFTRDITVPLYWKVRLPLGHVGLLMPVKQQAKKGAVTLLAGVIDPSCRGETELLLHTEGKRDYIWNPEDSLGCFLVFMTNGKT